MSVLIARAQAASATLRQHLDRGSPTAGADRTREEELTSAACDAENAAMQLPVASIDDLERKIAFMVDLPLDAAAGDILPELLADVRRIMAEARHG